MISFASVRRHQPGTGAFTNRAGGSITGGAGGRGLTGNTRNGADRGGGAGVTGSDLTIVNAGAISGGLSQDGSTRTDAITFTGGTSNELTLSDGTRIGSLTGGIGIGGALSIDPGTAAGRNVSLGHQIHDYSGTATGSLAKTGAGTPTLSGANTCSGGTLIQAGNLQSGAAGTGSIRFATLRGTATARLTVQITAQPTNVAFANTLVTSTSGAGSTWPGSRAAASPTAAPTA